jgi:hypothetical protein
MKNEDYLVGMNLLNVAIQSQLQMAKIRDILCPYYSSLTEKQQKKFDKDILTLKEKYAKMYEKKEEKEYQKWSRYYDRLLKEKYKGVDINDE